MKALMISLMLGVPFLFAPFGRPPVFPTGASGERDSSSETGLTAIPVALSEVDTVRVNTERKALLADGSWNDVYEFRRPAPGNRFLEIAVQVAVDGETVLFRDEVSLVDERNGNGEAAAIHPFYWYPDLGREPEDPVGRDRLVIRDKATVQMVFEIPERSKDDLALFVRGLRVMDPGSLASRSAS